MQDVTKRHNGAVNALHGAFLIVRGYQWHSRRLESGSRAHAEKLVWAQSEGACKDNMRVCQIAWPTTVEGELFAGFLAAGPVPKPPEQPCDPPGWMLKA